MNLRQSISNLDYWFDTWKDSENGIHGYVVHHHADAIKVISPDTWTQSSVLLGHLNLYNKSKQIKWLKKAISEANYLVKNYVWEQNYFHNAMFEHKPGNEKVYTNLIHNAYPAYALLKLCKILKKQRKSYHFYLKVCKDVIINQFFKKNWNNKKKIFTRGFDDSFTLNMASTAIRAIIYFDEITNQKGKLIKKYCVPTADAIIKYQKSNGCFPYTSDMKGTAPLIYIGITMQGLISLFKITKQKKYFDSCVKAANFLIQNIDSKTGLFYHRYEDNILFKYPEFVAGSMLIVHQLKRLEEFGLDFPAINKVINSVIKRQFKSGGIQQFIGFSDIFMSEFYGPEPEKKKWRDLLPIPGWNGLAFDALTYCFNGKRIPKPTNNFPTKYISEKCDIFEYKDKVIFKQNGKIIAKWTKIKHIWDFGLLKERPGDERIKHQLFIWKKRLWFLKPILNKIYPFKISKK